MKQGNFPIVVFDIGGTWFRSGLFTSNSKLISVEKVEAINYRNTKYSSVLQLQNSLVNYLIDQTEKLCKDNPALKIKTASISVGAALNAHNGLILNSGPLWGPNSKPFNLLKSLKEKVPSIKWCVINDISASLLRNIQSIEHGAKVKTTLITVSSGIGARTYDHRTESIPLDSKYGIQGEIGHIPINFYFRNKQINSRCDCGGHNHLNAFCSGRGIESVLPKIFKLFPEDFKKSKLNKNADFRNFIKAINSNDILGKEILNCITKPLAELIINLFTFDPSISMIILTGGVAHSLDNKYLNSLLKNLNQIGLYQITNNERSFFKNKIVMGINDDNSGLIGAALYAKTKEENSNGKMIKVSAVNKPVTYQIYSVNDLFNFKIPPELFRLNNGYYQSARRIIFIDRNVNRFYGQKIKDYLAYYQIEAEIITLSVSEYRKNKQLLFKVIDELIKFKVARRSEPIIVIGGGVIMDVVGLASSLYKRGIPYIRVPTTLLGIVDAGVGVKTAINYQGRKSQVGSYYPPLAIFNDLKFLETLPSRHIKNGLAEILKIALVKDKKLFKLLQKHSGALIKSKFQFKERVAQEIIHRSIVGMIEELEPNLWEDRLKRKVDYGHTFSPAIEMKATPILLHDGYPLK